MSSAARAIPHIELSTSLPILYSVESPLNLDAKRRACKTHTLERGRAVRRAAFCAVLSGKTRKDRMAVSKKRSGVPAASRAVTEGFPVQLELATRGLLALNVSVLEQMEKRIGLAALRALQSLERLGPSRVTELGDDLDLLSSTASRLSDRLADAGYITRSVSPTNRRATLLELTDAGRAVLDELVALRVQAFGEVAALMSDGDRAALVQGTRAFTDAHRQLSDRARQDRTGPVSEPR